MFLGYHFWKGAVGRPTDKSIAAVPRYHKASIRRACCRTVRYCRQTSVRFWPQYWSRCRLLRWPQCPRCTALSYRGSSQRRETGQKISTWNLKEENWVLVNSCIHTSSCILDKQNQIFPPSKSSGFLSYSAHRDNAFINKRFSIILMSFELKTSALEQGTGIRRFSVVS